MAMVDEIRSSMMAAMKAGDTKRKVALSALLAALKDGVIKKREDLTSEEEHAIIARELKQAKETLEAAQNGHEGLAAECRYLIEVYSSYLPAQMGEEEIRSAIEGVLRELGIAEPSTKDKGRVMKELMPLVKGKADGKLVNDILGGYLSQ